MLHNSVSLSQAKQYIFSMDFSKIIEKMVNYNDWVKDDAVMTCFMYKKFLFLKKKYGPEELIPPSKEIDECWHYHILDSRSYFEMCANVFDNKYLHHYPYFGIDGKTNLNDLNNAFSQTQNLYYKEFGEYIVATKYRYPEIINFIRKKMSKYNISKLYNNQIR